MKFPIILFSGFFIAGLAVSQTARPSQAVSAVYQQAMEGLFLLIFAGEGERERKAVTVLLPNLLGVHHRPHFKDRILQI